MAILVNNAECDFISGQSLKDMLVSMKLESKKGIAVSVNQRIIPRANWEQEKLKEDDQVVIIEASQGG
jgi:sulfur carrier protein